MNLKVTSMETLTTIRQLEVLNLIYMNEVYNSSDKLSLTSTYTEARCTAKNKFKKISRLEIIWLYFIETKPTDKSVIYFAFSDKHHISLFYSAKALFMYAKAYQIQHL